MENDCINDMQNQQLAIKKKEKKGKKLKDLALLHVKLPAPTTNE